MATDRHLEYLFRAHYFWGAWARHFKFGTWLEIHEANMGNLQNWQNSKTKMATGRNLGIRFRPKCRLSGLSQTLWSRHMARDHEGNMGNHQNCPKSKSKMAAVRHLEYQFRAHNFRMAWARHFKFGTGLEIRDGTWRNHQNCRKSKSVEWLGLDTSNLAQG